MNLLSSQTKRDILSFFLTFLIYLPILVWWLSQVSDIVTIPDKPDKQLSLDLNSFHKEECIEPEIPDEPIEEKVEEEIEAEPVIDELAEEEPIVKPIIDKVIPVPEVILSEKPKPIVIKKPKIKKRIPKKIYKKKISKKKRSVRKNKRKISSKKKTKKARSSSANKNRFEARLKAKINANKSYPRIAQKRGMQGNVKVRFRITSSGKLSGLTATGPRIFINSAKKAVRKAFPLSTRGVSLPMNVTLTLNYRLKK